MRINITFDLQNNTILEIDNEILERKSFLVRSELLIESSISYNFKENWKWIFTWSADKIGYEFIEIREYFNPDGDSFPPLFYEHKNNFRTLAKWSYDPASNELYKLIYNKEYFPDVSEIKIEVKNQGRANWALNFSNKE